MEKACCYNSCNLLCTKLRSFNYKYQSPFKQCYVFIQSPLYTVQRQILSYVLKFELSYCIQLQKLTNHLLICLTAINISLLLYKYIPSSLTSIARKARMTRQSFLDAKGTQDSFDKPKDAQRAHRVCMTDKNFLVRRGLVTRLACQSS